MASITIVFSVLFIALGVGGYVATDRTSWTALIPAIFGALLLLCGVMAMKDSLRKHAMHAAAGLALVGILGAMPGVIKFFQMMSGAQIDRPAAVKAQAAMALLAAVYMAFSVRSFIQARRRRMAEAKG